VRQCVDSAQARQREVEQDEVRPQLGRAIDGALGVGRLADDVELALAQQRGKCIARQRMVVDDEDPDRQAS
jgi:hypothetical protein